MKAKKYVIETESGGLCDETPNRYIISGGIKSVYFCAKPKISSFADRSGAHLHINQVKYPYRLGCIFRILTYERNVYVKKGSIELRRDYFFRFQLKDFSLTCIQMCQIY